MNMMVRMHVWFSKFRRVQSGCGQEPEVVIVILNVLVYMRGKRGV